jgi:hypothetical protein
MWPLQRSNPPSRGLAVVFALSFLCLGVFSNSSRVSAQDCAQILHAGIYDIRINTTDVERSASFVHWFRQHKFSSYQEAKSFAAQLAIPIEGLLVGLGLTADDKGFSTFMENIE